MSLLQRALNVYQGLLAEDTPQNCYWYGWVDVAHDRSATIRAPGKNPAKCAAPRLQAPYEVGWPDVGGTPLVGTNGGNTIAYTDCSGFVSYLIYGESESAYKAIPQQLAAITDPVLRKYLAQINQQHGQPWPSAADLAVLGLNDAHVSPPFQSLGGNAGLDPATLQPGDILAWALDAGGSDTGHVVIVHDGPVKQNDGSWQVNVIDASILEHADDSRPGGTGVGSGIIALEQASDGTWSINFDVGVDQFRPTRYTSGLRLNV